MKKYQIIPIDRTVLAFTVEGELEIKGDIAILYTLRDSGHRLIDDIKIIVWTGHLYWFNLKLIS